MDAISWDLFLPIFIISLAIFIFCSTFLFWSIKGLIMKSKQKKTVEKEVRVRQEEKINKDIPQFENSKN
ncbi:MAG: hypothetical protein GQ557_01310 [Mycoplasmataceae bacterium]|nr:hypothetical protein [Mycoplasmataceae bacterium]